MPRVCPECGAHYEDQVKRCPADGAPTVAISSEEALVGKVIDGRFTVRALIGSGGMGAVYRAYQHSMDREVAIKVIRPELARNEAQVLRFFREARAASRLTSPYTITVYDFGQTEDGLLYLVMEYLRGQPLTKVLRSLNQGMEVRRAVNIASQILQALVHAHAMGVLHRDLKPDNVFLVQDEEGKERVKVLDFGIAKVMGGETGNLTTTGMVVGTPAYMSPEQAMGQELDARCDLYAVGVILFEMLAGRLPFQADTPMGIVYKKVNERAPLLSEAVPGLKVPHELERFVARLLEKDPNDRFPTAKAALEALNSAFGIVGVQEVMAPPEIQLPEASVAPKPTAPSKVTKPQRTVPIWLSGSISTLALLGLLAWWFLTFLPGEPKPAQTQSMPDPAHYSVPDWPEPIAEDTKKLVEALQSANVQEVEARLEDLVKARIQAGIPDLVIVANAFLALYKKIHARPPPDVDSRIAKTAIEIAPNLPDLYFNYARARLRCGIKGVPSSVGAYLAGVKAYFRHPPSFIGAASNVALPIFRAMALLVIIFSVLLTLRYAVLFAHNLGHRFGWQKASVDAFQQTKTTMLQAAIPLVVVFFLFPALSGFGLLTTLTIGLLAASAYASKRELATIAAIFVLAASLYPAGRIFRLATLASSATGALAWSCMEGGCDNKTFSELEERVNAGNSGPWSRYALAAHIMWTRGSDMHALEKAERYLSKDEGSTTFHDTVLGHIRLLRAITDCVEEQPNTVSLLAAEKSYRSALASSNESANKGDFFVLAHTLTGLAITQRLLGRTTEAEATGKRLLLWGIKSPLDAIGFAKKSEEPCLLREEIRNHLRVPSVPPWDIYLDALPTPPPAIPMASLLLGFLPAKALPVVSFLGLLCLPIIRIATSTKDLATRCPKCGSVSCRSCDIRTVGFDMCAVCLTKSIKPAFVDPTDFTLAHQHVKTREHIRRLATIIAALLLPGWPQLLCGRPWRGFLLISVAAACASYVVTTHSTGGGLALLVLAFASTASVLDTIVMRR